MGCLVPFLQAYWHQALPHNQPRVLATCFPSVAVLRRFLLLLYESFFELEDSVHASGIKLGLYSLWRTSVSST